MSEDSFFVVLIFSTVSTKCPLIGPDIELAITIEPVLGIHLVTNCEFQLCTEMHRLAGNTGNHWIVLTKQKSLGLVSNPLP